MDNKTRDKIEKLLALSTSNFEAEAAAAKAKAEELMRAHDITDVRKILYTEVSLFVHSSSELDLMALCAAKSGCYGYFYKRRAGKYEFVFYGLSHRINVARELAAYCLQVGRRELRAEGYPNKQRYKDAKYRAICLVLVQMADVWIDLKNEAKLVYNELNGEITKTARATAGRSTISTNINLDRQATECGRPLQINQQEGK